MEIFKMFKKVKLIFALIISVAVIMFILFGSFSIATKIGGIFIYTVCFLVLNTMLSQL
jgi:hypothetical protein